MVSAATIDLPADSPTHKETMVDLYPAALEPLKSAFKEGRELILSLAPNPDEGALVDIETKFESLFWSLRPLAQRKNPHLQNGKEIFTRLATELRAAITDHCDQPAAKERLRSALESVARDVGQLGVENSKRTSY